MAREQRAFVLRVSPGGVDYVPKALESNDIIIGWSKAKGLLSPDLEWKKFRKIMHDCYYSKDEGFQRSGRAAGTMWRFIREMEEGDLVVVPHGHGFYVAKIQGPARLEEGKVGEDSAHRRTVIWLNEKRIIPRKIARASLQSRMKIQNTCVDATDIIAEIREVLEHAEKGKLPTFGEELGQQLVNIAISEIRSGRINSYGFEKLIESLLRALGAVEIRHPHGILDKGADLVATFRIARIFDFKIAVQAKHYKPEPPVDSWVIDQLIQGMEAESADLGMVVTSGTFSDETEQYAKKVFEDQGRKIELVDGEQLVSMMLEVGIAGFVDKHDSKLKK
jgi:predicted Mrr-cat superfamily restriction endonuclease